MVRRVRNRTAVADSAERGQGPPEDSDDGGDVEDVEEDVDLEDTEGDPSSGKRKSMASAFNRILGKKSKNEVPIFSERKIISEDSEKKSNKTLLSNRKKALEIREKGHVKDVRPGANAEQDAVEKTLVRTATRGVVQLFNAIHQAQQQQQKAGKDKEMVRQAKTKLFEQLDGAAKNMSRSQDGRKASSSASAGNQSGGSQKTGWNVLGEGFSGLSGGKKLKDWDKEVEEEDNLGDEMEEIEEDEEEEEEED